MTAHDSAGPHASLMPPLPVLLPRFPPGPPSPRLSAGPGLGRRGAIEDGDGAMLAERTRCAPRPAAALASTGVDVHHAACAAHLIGGR
jgi:hypothetical protein